MDEHLEEDVIAAVDAVCQPDMPINGLFGFAGWFRGVLAEDPAHLFLRDVVVGRLKERVKADPDAPRPRFVLGLLYYDNRLLDHAIECFQETRKDRGLVLHSYRMLGRCFSEKVGFNMEDLAVKQYRKGLETRGYAEWEYNELRYELALLYARQHLRGAACDLFRQVHAIDPTLHDVQKWVDWCGGSERGDDGGAAVPLTPFPGAPAGSAARDLPEESEQ